MSDFISDKTQFINDTRDKAVTSVKQYTRPKMISAIFELLISMACIIGIQFVMFGFNIDALKHWNFWMKVGASTLGVFFLYRAVINGRFEKTATRESVVKVREEYNTKNKMKDLGMKDWLKNVFNLKSKIEAYTDKQNRKIMRLENKLARCYSPRRKPKLEAKLEALKETITAEYINEHIDKIHIKYYMVFYSDFQDENTYGGKGGLYTRGNYNGAFNKASFNKMWAYILSSALLGISVFSSGAMDVATILVNVGSSALMIITRIVTALLEADTLYDKTITRSMLGRIEVLDEYIAYGKNHPQPSEIDKIKQKVEAEADAKYKAEYQEKLKTELEKYKQELKSKVLSEMKKEDA